MSCRLPGGGEQAQSQNSDKDRTCRHQDEAKFLTEISCASFRVNGEENSSKITGVEQSTIKTKLHQRHVSLGIVKHSYENEEKEDQVLVSLQRVGSSIIKYKKDQSLVVYIIPTCMSLHHVHAVTSEARRGRQTFWN